MRAPRFRRSRIGRCGYARPRGRPRLHGDVKWPRLSRARSAKAMCSISTASLPSSCTPRTSIPARALLSRISSMRRIADGVKVVERYRTTDQVERAYLDEKDYNYLYEDDMGFNFMQPETFDQITIPKDVVGDSGAVAAGGHDVLCDAARRHSDRDRAAAARHASRSSRPIPSLKARRRHRPTSLRSLKRCPRDGAAPHRSRHPRRRHDRRRLLRRARQGLISTEREWGGCPIPVAVVKAPARLLRAWRTRAADRRGRCRSAPRQGR